MQKFEIYLVDQKDLVGWGKCYVCMEHFGMVTKKTCFDFDDDPCVLILVW